MFELREKHTSQVSEENKWDWSLMKCDWDKVLFPSTRPGVLWEIVPRPPALPEDTWDKIVSCPPALDKYDWDSIPPMGAGESAYRMLVLMGDIPFCPDYLAKVKSWDESHP
jgi:hypothetical protein